MNAVPVSWSTLDWPALERLRERFLDGRPGGGSYWTCRSDLENYDFTFAQRIGWKWDSVLQELKQRGWTPPSNVLLDWGCGSGVAGRRVVAGFGEARFAVLQVDDQSPLAVEFAAGSARARFPSLEIKAGASADGGIGTLVLSHVLNELDEAGHAALRHLINRAEAVVWVEPGTHADSRSLIALREGLRDSFHVVAPCTHQAACGLTVPENERHWCHHFARPPVGIMGDSNWVRFAQRAGIDLRSLPYSFLALERKGLRNPVPGLVPEGFSRIIGEPRFYKGYAKVFRCQADGARDVRLQKRDAPNLFRDLKRGDAQPIQRWAAEDRSNAGG